MNWSKPSLLRDFTLLAALILFVLLVASIWVTYETYLDQSERIVHELETEATRVDRAMIIEIEHSSYLLEALGRQISHMNTQDLGSIALLLRSFDTTATVHHVFSWIDDNQNNVVSSNRGVHPKPIDVSDRDFVKKAISEPWKLQIGRPIQGRVSEKWVLPVAMGLTDTTGKFIGTILISMDIDTITRDLHNAVRDQGISFAVFSTTMLPLTNSQDISPTLESFSQQLKAMDFSKHPNGVFSNAKLPGDVPLYVYYEVSAQYPYVILLGLDSRVGIASIRELLIPRLMQILLLAVFMIAILWIVRLRIIKPVSDLTDVTAGLMRGEKYHAPKDGVAGEVLALSEQIEKLNAYLHEQHRLTEEQESKNLSLRKAKESAELSNKIKTEFLIAMSHELRTPLNTIAGFSEIIKNQILGPMENSQYRGYALDIHESAQHLQSLIDDVLSLSNAETAMSEMQEKSIDVRFILNKCLRLVSERLQEHRLHVELKLPEVLPRLRVDELRLKQIIITLLLNAARHSIEDSSIIVQAYVDKDAKGTESFCISFVDFGTKTSVKGALSPSWQRGRGKNDVSNLSIPLTKALVAMHQATLDIQSPPGKPTSVILRFPQERIVH